MYYIGFITAALLFVSVQSEPTHIVKFKSFVSRASAPDMLLGHYQDFLSVVRQRKLSVNTTTREDLNLNRINLGKHFNAVEGVFSDHAFLDYLYKQSTVEYVEENQWYKTTLVRNHRRTEEEKKDFQIEDDDMEDGEEDQVLENGLLEVLKDKEILGNDTKDNIDRGPKEIMKDVILEETKNQTKKGKPSNWGLARINQHEKGSFEEYSYDPTGG
ncbi:hypothetical protein G6F56_012483 [Rhizopus delemar]|nr:hypothetical protein G6F56_012483 [Rhizopus delemar]